MRENQQNENISKGDGGIQVAEPKYLQKESLSHQAQSRGTRKLESVKYERQGGEER